MLVLSSAPVDLVTQTHAYLAQYGDSGMMTFVINQNSVVFEKNLGKETALATTAISDSTLIRAGS